MAAKNCIVPDIVWNWVIETLATFEQADASTLIGLVKLAPAISGELGNDAREVVSLRILESLFLQSDEDVVDTDSGQNSKISFDPSERCENVLKQILHETPEHSSKLEKEKWNILPFLTHKKSSLPKCILEKLNEVILENSHPLIASSKEEKSNNLAIPNVNFDVQDTVVKDDSTILNPRNDKGKFQENIEFVVKPNALLDDEHLNEEQNSMQHETYGFERIDSDENETDSLINICVKCNLGGELLTCCSDTCPIQVHERCLGFGVTFYENGKFFCPFCAYSRAISKYQEAKRKTSLARNDVQVFSSFTIRKCRRNESSKENEEGEGQKKVNEGVNGRNVDKHIIPQPSTPKRKLKESQRSTESSSRSREVRKKKAR